MLYFYSHSVVLVLHDSHDTRTGPVSFSDVSGDDVEHHRLAPDNWDILHLQYEMH
jgi:hypothetical protein